jgi:hypothetical protein
MAKTKGSSRPAATPPKPAPPKTQGGPAAGSSFLTPTPTIQVSVRKIANGYVASRSGMQGDKYVNQERFFPNIPKAK